MATNRRAWSRRRRRCRTRAARRHARDSERVEHQDPAADQRPMLDRLPVGVLVYRLDKLIYANRAFLDWTGYRASMRWSRPAGSMRCSWSPAATGRRENGTKSLAIATNHGDRLPVEARLFTSPWEGESALVLMLSGVTALARRKADDRAPRRRAAEARELRAMLDAAPTAWWCSTATAGAVGQSRRRSAVRATRAVS